MGPEDVNRPYYDREQQAVMDANNGSMPAQGQTVALAAHGNKPRSAQNTFIVPPNVYLVIFIKPGQTMTQEEGMQVDTANLANITLLSVQAVIGPGKEMLNMMIAPITDGEINLKYKPFRVSWNIEN